MRAPFVFGAHCAASLGWSHPCEHLARTEVTGETQHMPLDRKQELARVR